MAVSYILLGVGLVVSAIGIMDKILLNLFLYVLKGTVYKMFLLIIEWHVEFSICSF